MNSISIFVLTLTLTTFTAVQSYRQELNLYEGESGNSFRFESHVPDATIYPFENVTRICYRGLWTAYTSTDYRNLPAMYRSVQLECVPAKFSYASFRSIAQPETNEDGLSLYEGEYWNYRETLVTDFVTADVGFDVLSISWTGNSSWTLFEGPNFTGERHCIYKPSSYYGFTAMRITYADMNMKYARSVLKGGCYQNFPRNDILEIVKSHQHEQIATSI